MGRHRSTGTRRTALRVGSAAVGLALAAAVAAGGGRGSETGESRARATDSTLRSAPRATAESLPPATLTPPGWATFPADSDQITERARDAQRDFERLRRRHYPRAPLRHRRCHEVIGRFCLWHEDEDDWEPPAEPREVAEARAALITTLDSLTTLAPEDPWIQGHRVHYRIDADRTGEAVAVAGRCTARDRAWCDALLGYALHAAGRYRAADSAFAEALSAMPGPERCRWTELSLVLEEDGGDCSVGLEEPRRAYEEEVWWLAKPLFLIPGSDRRTEHLARHVLDRLHRDAASGYGVGWGDDLREIVLRYGWPAGWSLAWRDDPGLRTETAIQGHDPAGARRFLPGADWVGHPERVRRGEWSLDPHRPHTLYAPGYARGIDSLAHQVALFRRPDSTVIVGAFDRSRYAETACDSLIGGLFVAAGPRGPLAEARRVGRGPKGALRAAVPATLQVQTKQDVRRIMRPSGHLWFGLEAWCPADRSAERARYGVNVARFQRSGRQLSDLLVLDGAGSDSLPVTLEAAVPRALGSLRVEPESTLGLYWEVYGPASDRNELEVTISLARRGGGVFRKLAEWIGLAERGEAVGLRWRERARPGRTARSVALALRGLPDGRYVLRLEVAGGEAPASTVEREITIED